KSTVMQYVANLDVCAIFQVVLALDLGEGRQNLPRLLWARLKSGQVATSKARNAHCEREVPLTECRWHPNQSLLNQSGNARSQRRSKPLHIVLIETKLDIQHGRGGKEVCVTSERGT